MELVVEADQRPMSEHHAPPKYGSSTPAAGKTKLQVNENTLQHLDVQQMNRLQAKPHLVYKQVPNITAKFWAIFDTDK